MVGAGVHVLLYRRCHTHRCVRVGANISNCRMYPHITTRKYTVDADNGQIVGFLAAGLVFTTSAVNTLVYASSGAKEAAAAGFILLSMVAGCLTFVSLLTSLGISSYSQITFTDCLDILLWLSTKRRPSCLCRFLRPPQRPRYPLPARLTSHVQRLRQRPSRRPTRHPIQCRPANVHVRATQRL